MSKANELPTVEQWEIESTIYHSISEVERSVVDEMMGSLIDIGRAKGLDLWLLNPRANATREKLAQWIIDQRKKSTPGIALAT